jgi:methionyl-tRNA formyltransferase
MLIQVFRHWKVLMNHLIPTTKKDSVFLGSKSFGLEVFKIIYKYENNSKWTILHPDDSADSRSCLSEFREFAKSENIPFHVVNSSREASNLVFAIKPVIGLVCGWYWIISEEVLAFTGNNFWGIHNSLLPKYRGGSPLVWSIINGDEKVGCSVFRISKGIDDGEIAHQIVIENRAEDTIFTLLTKIQNRLLLELLPVWELISCGNSKLIVQNETEATYCGQRKPEDGVINWRMTSKEINAFCRAQVFPYPNAFTYVNGLKISIVATSVHEKVYFGTPGQILKREESSILVSCGGSSALEILVVEVNGEVRIPSDVITSISERFFETLN